MKAEHAEMAASHLGGGEMPEHKPMKEMHIKGLHDGTYHAMMHHGDPMKSPSEGSGDLERMHDMMHEHFGGEPNDKKAKKEPGEKKEKATSEKAEKPGGESEDKD